MGTNEHIWDEKQNDWNASLQRGVQNIDRNREEVDELMAEADWVRYLSRYSLQSLVILRMSNGKPPLFLTLLST